MKATQFSDFVSRYALYSYQTEAQKNPISKEESLINITNVFIDYDVPTSPQMQWLNDMGFLMYTKYYFRIQRVIMQLIMNMPATVSAIVAGQLMTSPLPNTFNGIMTPESMWRKLQIIPSERIDEAAVVPLYTYITGWTP